MVAVSEALNSRVPLGKVKNHDTIEKIAQYFVEHGITAPHKAVNRTLMVKRLMTKTGLSRTAIHNVLNDKPGFVVVPTVKEGQPIFACYFEEEAVTKAARLQQAKYYPFNTAAMFSDLELRDSKVNKPDYSVPGMSEQTMVVPLLLDESFAKTTGLVEGIMVDMRKQMPNLPDHRIAEALMSSLATYYEQQKNSPDAAMIGA